MVAHAGEWLTCSWRVRHRRCVIDAATGVEWAVVEMDMRGIPGAQGPLCLLFDSDRAVRRVWAFPADWRVLPDAGVLALREAL